VAGTPIAAPNVLVEPVADAAPLPSRHLLRQRAPSLEFLGGELLALLVPLGQDGLLAGRLLPAMRPEALIEDALLVGAEVGLAVLARSCVEGIVGLAAGAAAEGLPALALLGHLQWPLPGLAEAVGGLSRDGRLLKVALGRLHVLEAPAGHRRDRLGALAARPLQIEESPETLGGHGLPETAGDGARDLLGRQWRSRPGSGLGPFAQPLDVLPHGGG
jgi:hypothetical protein